MAIWVRINWAAKICLAAILLLPFAYPHASTLHSSRSTTKSWVQLYQRATCSDLHMAKAQEPQGRYNCDVPLSRQHTLPAVTCWTADVSLACHAHRLLQLTAPLLVENLASMGLSFVSTLFVGHLNRPLDLSAMVLATSVYNISGQSVVSGLASAMETLAGNGLCGSSCLSAGFAAQHCSWHCCPGNNSLTTAMCGVLTWKFACCCQARRMARRTTQCWAWCCSVQLHRVSWCACRSLRCGARWDMCCLC